MLVVSTQMIRPKAKSRTVVGPPVVLLPGQSAGKKGSPFYG